MLEVTPRAEPATVPPRPGRARLVALDVFRGLMVAGMILVNAEGSGDHVLPGLAHARWNGVTPADLVFPGFLVAMGVALGLARTPPSWARVARRTAGLFALGFAVNALPALDLGEVHVMGVLQRIALCYLLIAVASRWLRSTRSLAIAIGVAVVGYWAVLAGWPLHLGAAATPTDGGLVGLVDRAVLGVRHIYGNGPVDPEGLLSTLPAAATALVGVVVGRELRSPSRAVFRRLVAAGLGLAAAGWAWSVVLPMNKRLWTSSFAMFTAGAGVAAIGALLLVADRRPDVLARRPLRQARSLGANALLLYLLAEELIAMAGRTSIGSVSARAWLWRHAFAWWSGPMLGSLLYSLALLAVLVWVASTLERRRLHVRL